MQEGFVMPYALKQIYECIKTCALALQAALQTDDTSYLTTHNASGDTQLGIDVLADTLIEQHLLKLSCVCGVCSEEKSGALYKDCTTESNPLCDNTNDSLKVKLDSNSLSQSLQAPNGGLLVAYDPLDGSSLFDSNLSVGSIFGIYDGCFSAKHIIAAGYVVYGPRLEVVFAHNEVSHSFYNGKEWITKPNLTLKQQGKLNAPGGTQKHFSPIHRALIEGFFAQGYRLRYSGGMVPDLHQILCKGGGIFSYPATSDAPNGKLRKLFEVFPFAFIYQKAGGLAIDGVKNLLELPCLAFHESTPCFLGSKEEIEQVRNTYTTLGADNERESSR